MCFADPTTTTAPSEVTTCDPPTPLEILTNIVGLAGLALNQVVTGVAEVIGNLKLLPGICVQIYNLITAAASP